MELLRWHDEFLIDLHAEVPVNGKTIDIALGPEEDQWELGIEIKRTGDIQEVEKDLEKLRSFMENNNIEAGIFLTIAQHSANLKSKFQEDINADYKLEEEDTRNNNFMEWHRVKIDEYNIDWDTLSVVLRRLE